MDDLIREIEGLQAMCEGTDAPTSAWAVIHLCGLTVALARQVGELQREARDHTHGLRTSEHRTGRPIKAGY